MNSFPGRWRIPSAFGNEPPRKGLGFDELPRVRELQQRYAQSSDEEVLDAFRNARITDSVLRFFLYMEAKKRRIDSKLSQENHNEKIEFEEGEIIIFIFYLQKDIGIILAIILFIIVLLCICIYCRIVSRLSYLTNKRIVINDEFCQFIKIINIKFVEMEGSYILNLSGPVQRSFYISYLFRTFIYKQNDHLDLRMTSF